jgi:ribulose-phosphate 3-epimerase
MVKIAPSILSADFSRLGEEVRSIECADYLHFDVMDGVFVPNLSIGLPVLESVRKITNMTLDVHLMVTSPSRFAARFAESGADIVTFHVEAQIEPLVHSTIDTIHRFGKRAGLSLRPDTPATEVLPFIEKLDLVLVMTVEPGFGGQGFLPEVLPKIAELRGIIDGLGLPCEIEVDGGINAKTAAQCVEAGADVLVAGNYIFLTSDRESRIAKLRGA